ncbi:MAG: HAMP domain-containing sensor histidine kinase, partial [Saprospiraceae bacterium]
MNTSAHLSRLSFITALICSLLMVLFFYGLNQLGFFKVELYYLFIFYLLNLSLSYLLIRYMLMGYIQRRLKIIYKLINVASNKPGSISNAENGSKSDFDFVENDIEEWLKLRNDEKSAMIELEKYRKEYIGNVSHELKTPIFNLQGYLQTLINGGIHDESVNMKFLNKAMSNAERLQIIVEDLEAISRIESKEYETEFREFDIKILSQEVFDDLSSKANEKNIRLVYKSEEEKPMVVVGDREQIRLVLTNLVQNGIKYGIKNGFVKIRTYDVDSKVLIEVADNGIGIPEESLLKVFDRF